MLPRVDLKLHIDHDGRVAKTFIAFRRTYSIVTDESAKDGDFAEHGWLTADGRDWPIGDDEVGEKCGPGSNWAEGRERATMKFFNVAEALAWLERDGAPIHGKHAEWRHTSEMSLDGEVRETTWHLADDLSDPRMVKAFNLLHKKRSEELENNIPRGEQALYEIAHDL